MQTEEDKIQKLLSGPNGIACVDFLAFSRRVSIVFNSVHDRHLQPLGTSILLSGNVDSKGASFLFQMQVQCALGEKVLFAAN